MIALSQKTLLNPFEKASISCTKGGGYDSTSREEAIKDDTFNSTLKMLLKVVYLQ